MRKILLFKTMERAIRDKQDVAVVEYNRELNDFKFIEINLEELPNKKNFYYNNLDDTCTYKNNRYISVISIYVGKEIEMHRNII